MANPRLTATMREHLERQIAWYELLLHELETLPADVRAEDLDALTERQRQRAEGTRRLEEEFQALRKQWDADRDLSPEERQVMRVLAERAGALAARLTSAHEDALTVIGLRRDALDRSLKELRRGRDMLRRYGPGRTETPNRLDRKA